MYMMYNELFHKIMKEHPISHKYIGGCNQNFPEWPPGARTANGTALYH